MNFLCRFSQCPEAAIIVERLYKSLIVFQQDNRLFGVFCWYFSSMTAFLKSESEIGMNFYRLLYVMIVKARAPEVTDRWILESAPKQNKNSVSFSLRGNITRPWKETDEIKKDSCKSQDKFSMTESDTQVDLQPANPATRTLPPLDIRPFQSQDVIPIRQLIADSTNLSTKI